MWSLVVFAALATAINPVRLGVILLMISRPRPVQNLVVYWAGCLVIGIPALVVPLLVINFTPAFKSQVDSLAAPGPNNTVRFIQLGVGALALAVALVIALRPLMRKRARPARARHRADGAAAGFSTGPMAVDSDSAISTLPPSTRVAAVEKDSWWRRMVARGRRLWEGDSLWVALVMGLGTGPPADGMLIVLTAILSAGVALSTQLIAGTVYVLGTLAIAEIMLVSYLVTPAKTEVVIRWLHDWTRAHWRPLLVTIFGIVGILMLATGAQILG
jgi:hypothetical protein